MLRRSFLLFVLQISDDYIDNTFYIVDVFYNNTKDAVSMMYKIPVISQKYPRMSISNTVLDLLTISTRIQAASSIYGPRPGEMIGKNTDRYKMSSRDNYGSIE